MTEYFGTTVADIFATMPKRFKPEEAKEVDIAIGYEATGEGGGKWKATIKHGTLKVETVEGELTGCKTTIHTDAETFIGVTLGKIGALDALSSQKLRVAGDPKFLMLLLPKIFTPYSAPAKKPDAVTAQDIIATIVERFRPEKAEGVAMAIGYDLSGEGGGRWTIVIRDGKCEVREGLTDPFTVKMTMDAKTYAGMMTGTIEAVTAFTSGQVKIEGDMAAAGATAKFFRKYVVAGITEAEELISLRVTNSMEQRFASGPVMGRWFAGLREKKFLANRCPKCGRTQIPPREICAWCHIRVHEFVEVGPKGVITHFDIVHFASPDPLTGAVRETPYATAYVVLDGATEREAVTMDLKKEDIPRLKEGARVRPVWAEVTTGSYRDLIGVALDEQEDAGAGLKPAPASMTRQEEHKDCFVLEGKMALPNQYFAGTLGSRFLIAIRDRKKIMGLKCNQCGKTFVPPREYCVTCWTKIADNWVELGTEGELVNFTVVRYGDRHLPKKPPYILGQILLDGADTPLVHIVEGIDPREVGVGVRVKAVFAAKTTNTIMDIDHFEPV